MIKKISKQPTDCVHIIRDRKTQTNVGTNPLYINNKVRFYHVQEKRYMTPSVEDFEAWYEVEIGQ